MTKEIDRSVERILTFNKPISDLDGPRGDIHTKAVEIANRYLKNTYQVTDVRKWHAVRDFALAEGWSKDDANELERLSYYDCDNLMEVEPTSGAVELSWAYYSKGKSFPTLTSRHPKYRDVTFAWHELHFPWMPHKDIFIRQDTEMDGDVFKVYITNLYGRDLFFEDIPEQAQFILDYTQSSVVLVSHLRILEGSYKDRLMRIDSADGVSAANLTSLVPHISKITG